ncbi:MAG: 16S rRNA (cytosine(1402)-N(4))-methyltransferase RsmH [Gemmatimonadaceae bacterium]
MPAPSAAPLASPPDAAAFASAWHDPVMVREVCEALRTCPTVLDGTLGGGGHSAALRAAGHQVIGLDRDPAALAEARARLADLAEVGRFEGVLGNHDAIDEVAALTGRRVDGILLDLGVSSHQIDDDARGFSFRPGVPLDMRMDPTQALTAADLLNTADAEALTTLFREAGDEPKARRLAQEIVRRRARAPFTVSDDLVGAIRAVLGPRSGPSEFARLFQAVRIGVNDELDGLRHALVSLRERLTSGGVLAVISYHSGEDRVVKHAFREWSTACSCPPLQPRCTCGGVALGTALTRKAMLATVEEIARNPRARSAKLRCWRRAGGGG